jgi:hypothetical protein
MTSEQEKELIEYLASMGFIDDTLAVQIHQNAERKLPSFRIQLIRDYGEERMQYDLQFRRDMQFNSYRLEEYEAKHRYPIEILPQIINGINTLDLSDRMSLIDWKSFFKDVRAGFDGDQLTQIDSIMDDLVKLESGNDANGWEAQKKLQYKYWPESAYDPASMHFKNSLEHKRTFMPHENGMCNADLAYHVVSGRLDELHEKLSTVEVDQQFGEDLYVELERKLSKNPADFDIKFFRNDPEGFSEITIPIYKEDNDYVVEEYTVSFTPYPEIQHGNFAGINTKELEDMMRQIDWHDPKQLFVFRDVEEPQFPQNINDVQDQIYRLSQDMAGSDVADKLMLKYWADADFFESMVPQAAWDHLESLPKKEQDFPLELTAKTAVNLLSGRAAINKLEGNEDWVRFDLSGKNIHDEYPIIHISGFQTKDLETVLDRLPVPQHNYYLIRNALLAGDITQTKLNDERKVLLVADPEHQTIQVYTTGMKLIPTNLRLDPDWKPDGSQTINVKIDAGQSAMKNTNNRPTRPIKRSRGKGI